MVVVVDVRADVVDDRAELEPGALARAERVPIAGRIEELHGESRDLLRVRRLIAAALGQLDDAPPPHVGIAFGRADVGGVALDVVEHEPLAQREVAERQRFRAQPSRIVSSRMAPTAAMSAPRIEPGQPEPLVQAHRDQALAQLLNVVGTHGKPAEIGRAAAHAGRERAEREDRARRADDLLNAPGAASPGAPGFPPDVPHEPPLVGRAQRIAFREPLGQPDGAQLEAAAELHARRRAQRDFQVPPPRSMTTAARRPVPIAYVAAR